MGSVSGLTTGAKWQGDKGGNRLRETWFLIGANAVLARVRHEHIRRAVPVTEDMLQPSTTCGCGEPHRSRSHLLWRPCTCHIEVPYPIDRIGVISMEPS